VLFFPALLVRGDVSQFLSVKEAQEHMTVLVQREERGKSLHVGTPTGSSVIRSLMCLLLGLPSHFPR